MSQYHESIIVASGVSAAVVGYIIPIMGMISSFSAAVISALIATGKWTWGRRKKLEAELAVSQARVEALEAARHEQEEADDE